MEKVENIEVNLLTQDERQLIEATRNEIEKYDDIVKYTDTISNLLKNKDYSEIFNENGLSDQ